jgi:UDP-N-acetylmuramyl tripeptide synthase
MDPTGRLWTVFGVAGSGTTAKICAIGREVRARSDELILTTSGYRGDPALAALQGHLAGAREATGGSLEVVLDRRRAMERALRAAAPGDAVVFPGRGALPAMTPDPRGLPIPFDDREVVREILRSL